MSVTCPGPCENTAGTCLENDFLYLDYCFLLFIRYKDRRCRLRSYLGKKTSFRSFGRWRFRFNETFPVVVKTPGSWSVLLQSSHVKGSVIVNNDPVLFPHQSWQSDCESETETAQWNPDSDFPDVSTCFFQWKTIKHLICKQPKFTSDDWQQTWIW